MSKELTHKEYTSSFGPTEGSRIRLADTNLIAEIEEDRLTHGDECVFGGGKTLRDGLGQSPHTTSSSGALDWVLSNLVIIDPVQGVVKADIGIKDGKIAGVGKAGNPNTMEGVDPDLVVGAATDVISAEGQIATAGAIDPHVHWDGANIVESAISSGVTTMIGGGTGPATVGITTSGKGNLKTMIQAGDEFPVNIGFYGKGSCSEPEPIEEQLKWGACGLKIHEDWGAMTSVIETCLDVADSQDVHVAIHGDTLNECGFVEDHIEAINGRTIHPFHVEGAGGGHAPDIMEVIAESNMLPSSTNPSMPWSVNTLDEHLDMMMVCHHLSPDIPTDVAFAESRVRAETISAEDVFHDMGAISMMTTDSQGAGRMAEQIQRTWQTAHKMKEKRGQLSKNDSNDNDRIMRYIAKYTINPAIATGIDQYVGSIEKGKMADIVLWDRDAFGLKPDVVIKGGYPISAQMGEGNGSLMKIQPVKSRPQWAAHGRAKNDISVVFSSQSAVDNNIGEKYDIQKDVLPVQGTRGLSKEDMMYNDHCPDNLDIDPDTFEVILDGEVVTTEAVEELPLTQRYMI